MADQPQVGVKTRDIASQKGGFSSTTQYRNAKKGGRGNKGDKKYHVSRQYVGHARTILIHAPDIADNVITGAVSLNDAYQTAKERKRAAESDDAQPDRCYNPSEASGDLKDGKSGAVVWERKFLNRMREHE